MKYGECGVIVLVAAPAWATAAAKGACGARFFDQTKRLSKVL
jgi:hypothetical protein